MQHALSVAQSNRTNIYENFVKRNAEKLDSSCWTLFDRVNAQSDTKSKDDMMRDSLIFADFSVIRTADVKKGGMPEINPLKIANKSRAKRNFKERHKYF